LGRDEPEPEPEEKKEEIVFPELELPEKQEDSKSNVNLGQELVKRRGNNFSQKKSHGLKNKN
jgi:hypothetical protein